MNMLSDRELVALAHRDPLAGYKQIYDKYWNLLFNIAFKRLQDTAEAQDMVQEVFVSVWDQLSSLEPRDSLLPYLQVILKHRILNHYAKHEVRLRYIVQAQWQTAWADNNIAQQITLKELQSLIDEAIASLPPRMQEIFLLSREDNMMPAQIAAHLSLSVQTVKNQLHRATEKLRQHLSIHVEPAVLLMIIPIIAAQ
jgi:RNA polymerase sigma-70 factor (ECF subfamily)